MYSYKLFHSEKAPSLARKYQSSLDLTDIDKHSSLPRYGINYDRKIFYRKAVEFTTLHFLLNLRIGLLA